MSKNENRISKVVGISGLFKLQTLVRKYSVSAWFLFMLMTPVLIIALIGGETIL